MIKFIKNKAESLLEVIVSIFVVSVGAAVATSLIVTSLQSNSFSRDNLIALNLAQEGIEAVRLVRDTNWLKYSFDKDNCWNLLPGKSCTNAPDPNDTMIDGNYIAEFDPNNSWDLIKVGDSPATDLDLENNFLASQVYKLFTINKNNLKFYSHNTLSDPVDISDPQNERFYRMVNIVVEPATKEINVRSMVKWQAQNRTHTVFLDSKLTNYQK